MGDKIFVDSFTGDNSGDDLIDCYFKHKNDGTYDFHDKDGDHVKCSGLTVGSTSPSFQLGNYPGINWTITLQDPCSDTVVNGNWTSDDGSEQTQEGGTFNAQAGGGVDEDLGVEDAPEEQKIVIHGITSDHGHGHKFGGPLLNCYFVLRGAGTYDLCDPLGGVLKRDITWNESFDFDYDSQKWSMTSDIHTLEKKAHGRWALLEGIGSGDDIDGGTFTAQAGGGGGADEENAYSANA